MLKAAKFHTDISILLEDTSAAPSARLIYFERLRLFFSSKAFMLMCFLLAATFFALGLEVYGIIAFILLVSMMLIFIKDVLPSFLPLLLAAMIVLRMYDSFDVFKNYAWVIAPAAISIIFHFVAYPCKPIKRRRLGKLFLPYVAVSIALLFGGLGSITAAEYFNITTLYYVLALGLGMLGAYVLLYRHVNPNRDYDTKEYLAFSMFIAGALAVTMLAVQYATRAVPALLGPPFSYNIIEQYFCLSNNLCTIILMVMPFSFYLAPRKRYGALCFACGVLQGFAMLLSTSRSGFFFSFALTLPLIVMTLIRDKAKRKQYILTLIIIVLALAALLYAGYSKVWVPMFTNYAFRLQDNWKAYSLIAILSILVIGYFIILFVLRKKPQRIMLTVTLCVGAVAAVAIFVFWNKLAPIVIRLDESRGKMANLAVKNFFRFPIFGTGIGYKGTEAFFEPRTGTMHFYHSAPVQIIGSMGLVGVLAYSYMLIARIRVLRENNSEFNFTIYLCSLGLYLMSLVNPGIFIPLMVMLQFTLYYVIVEQNNTLNIEGKNSCLSHR